MAWTAPRTWVVGEIVTAALLNTHLRDNLLDLDSRAQTVQDAVDTDQSTTSTSFVNLTTTGPAVTLVTGTKAVVITTATFYNDSASADTLMSFAVTGASTISALDNLGPRFKNSLSGVGSQIRISVMEVANVNAGSNTFTAKYRVGSGTGHWLMRKLTVYPAVKLS